jgi:excinuclease ABC subunit C
MATKKAGPKKPRTKRYRPDESVPKGWTPRATNETELSDLVERLPDDPGVYVMRDRKGRVVYVGKARRLKSRVKQYFSGQDTRYFVPLLADLLGDIETIVTTNDKEAMLLENHLIKEHHPRFNFKLRDDKQYLVLRLDPNKDWPRLEVVRNIKQDKANYYGPYHSATSARHTLRVVNRRFQLRTCSDFVLSHRKRPCLQYQIGRCPAPCVYEVDEAAYAQQVKDVGLFLGGRHAELVKGLRHRMQGASDDLDYETAARVRDQLHAIETTLQAQKVVSTGERDQDVIGLYREGGQVELSLLQVRHGKLMGTQSFSQKGMEMPSPQVLYDFVRAYYDAAPFIPDEVVLPEPLPEDENDAVEAWLREKRERKVGVLVPERGDRKKLMSLAERNAESNFATRRNREEDSEAALSRLQKRLGLSRIPRRIECYDVSHLQGTDAMASMVVFVDGASDTSLYRTFKIRGLEGLAQGTRQNDDFASMYEVLSRRFKRAIEDDDWSLPDLMVIDGGKGQLSRVVTAMEDLGIPLGAEGVDVVALAKERRGELGSAREAMDTLRAFKEDRAATETSEEAPLKPGETLQEYVVEHANAEQGEALLAEDEAEAASEADQTSGIKPERVFIPGGKDPIRLRPGSSELFLMTRVRDEAHRFAIGHHRRRRGKRALKSVLDDIPGVGPAMKRKLIKHFGSIAAIKTADTAALEEVQGVGPSLATKITEALGRGSR